MQRTPEVRGHSSEVTSATRWRREEIGEPGRTEEVLVVPAASVYHQDEKRRRQDAVSNRARAHNQLRSLLHEAVDSGVGFLRS